VLLLVWVRALCLAASARQAAGSMHVCVAGVHAVVSSMALEAFGIVLSSGSQSLLQPTCVQ
jgi:hypothetical protein